CSTANVSCGPPLNILLDPTGAAAFVLNQGVPSQSIQPTIYPYNVNSDGSLSGPGTPLPLGYLAVTMIRDTPGQFLFEIDGGQYVSQGPCPLNGSSDSSYAGCPSISVYGMTPGSTALTLESGSPFYISRIPTALSTLTFTSGGTAQEFLFVTGNQDLTA